MRTRGLAVMVALVGGADDGRAQDVWRPVRLEGAPVIDGVLDDPVWESLTPVEGFRTYEPDYGSEMLGDTHVYMGYDDDNLYFGFVAFDPDPSEIRASVTSRDNINRDDWVAINLDSFGDAQSLYAFYINPLGIQGDSRLAAGNEDRGVDLVWFSAGRIEAHGYTVEVRIPLKSIRFREGDPVDMGVIFERRISRNSEWGTTPELDPARGGQWLTQMHPLRYDGIESPSVFELLPAVTYSVDKAASEGSLVTAYEEGDLSLTVKLGLTSDLVLDGTYNPDFSQVEADAGQVDVNLRSDIFHPEKRPFFLEGREHFGFAATGGFNPIRAVAYTRRIIDPIAGARLSGKLGRDHTLASIYAVDDLEVADGRGDYAHVPILRYKRSLSDDSYVGGMLTARETDGRSNRTAGVDGQFRAGESLLVEMHAAGSRTRPEASGSDTRDGRSLAMRLTSSTRELDWSFEVLDVSEGFESDVGFLTREGLFRAVGLVRARLFPGLPRVRRLDFALSSAPTRDHRSDLWESRTRLSAASHLFGSLNLRGYYQFASEVFRGERFDDSGFTATLGGLLWNKGAFGVSYGAQTRPIYAEDPYQGRSRSFSAILGLQPSSRVDLEASLSSVDFFREADDEKIYDFTLLRGKSTFQANRFLFVRGIAEYNWFRDELITDFLASFTYIPGTVVHLGYGSLYERIRWADGAYVPADDLLETKRRFFFKTSYLFRN